MFSGTLGSKVLPWTLAALICFGTGAALADSTLVKRGERVKTDGILLDEASSKRIAEDLKDLALVRALAEMQSAELAARNREIAHLREEIAALRDATRKQEIALAIAEDRDKRRQEDQERLIVVLRETREVLKESREAMKRADARIEKLESRLFWSQVLGPLGIVVGLIAGAGF